MVLTTSLTMLVRRLTEDEDRGSGSTKHKTGPDHTSSNSQAARIPPAMRFVTNGGSWWP